MQQPRWRSSLKTAIVLSLLQVCLRAQVPAQGAKAPSLSGSVRDESNNPVQATVTIATQGLRQSQLTAADGSFSFSNLKTGMFFACAVPPPGTNGQRYVNGRIATPSMCRWLRDRSAKALWSRYSMDTRWTST
jgi:hypothetical protein